MAEAGAGTVPLYTIEGGEEIRYQRDRPAASGGERTGAPPGLSDAGAFACRLGDDSMEPEFRVGDILFFSPAAEVESGCYACVRLEEKSTFRQVFLDEEIVRLVPANRKYPEVRVGRDQVKGMFRLVWRMQRF